LEIHPASPAPGTLIDLDAGEAAAIRLAGQYQGSAFLLMDDAKGRRDVLPRLLLTNFFIASSLVDALIAEDDRRRR
jgi:hypothetical protein